MELISDKAQNSQLNTFATNSGGSKIPSPVEHKYTTAVAPGYPVFFDKPVVELQCFCSFTADGVKCKKSSSMQAMFDCA